MRPMASIFTSTTARSTATSSGCGRSSKRSMASSLKSKRSMASVIATASTDANTAAAPDTLAPSSLGAPSRDAQDESAGAFPSIPSEPEHPPADRIYDWIVDLLPARRRHPTYHEGDSA